MVTSQRELNERQWEAATFGDGPLRVIAGPGTGKTTTLTARVNFLLERGVEPERILLLTFTRRSAREIVSRVRALRGAEQRSQSLGRDLSLRCPSHASPPPRRRWTARRLRSAGPRRRRRPDGPGSRRAGSTEPGATTAEEVDTGRTVFANGEHGRATRRCHG